jgi:hypothetical protein
MLKVLKIIADFSIVMQSLQSVFRLSVMFTKLLSYSLAWSAISSKIFARILMPSSISGSLGIGSGTLDVVNCLLARSARSSKTFSQILIKQRNRKLSSIQVLRVRSRLKWGLC